MALVRVTALKDFRSNALSTTDVSTGQQVGAVAVGQKLYAGFHLTQAADTGRPLTMKVQGATASGFGSPTDAISFTLSSARGGSLLSTGPSNLSTELKWWRLSWTLSTAASTAGSIKGIGYVGIR